MNGSAEEKDWGTYRKLHFWDPLRACTIRWDRKQEPAAKTWDLEEWGGQNDNELMKRT